MRRKTGSAGATQPPAWAAGAADDADAALIETAFAASSRAYAPNSGFRVGAAIRAGSGKVYVSANIENAAYDAVHAEASAIATARATEGDDLTLSAIAVVAQDAKGRQQPCSPCGACRQHIFEFSRTARVLFFHGDDLRLACETPAALLPYGFSLQP